MLNNEIGKYTSIEVFQIIKEQYNLVAPLSWSYNHRFELSKNTLIADLLDELEISSYREWTAWLNQCYRLEIPYSEWKKVIKPTSSKTMMDLCVFISENAEKQIIKPVKLLGKECLSSAVFLTLKGNLAKKGVNILDLKPSTRIADFLKDESNFNPLIEEVTLTGVKTFERIKLERTDVKNRFEYFLDKFFPNLFFKRSFQPQEIITLRDLVHKILEGVELDNENTSNAIG